MESDRAWLRTPGSHQMWCVSLRARACARTNQMVEGRHEIQLRRVSSQSEREFNLEAEHEVCA
jgi:hypothetical protein